MKYLRLVLASKTWSLLLLLTTEEQKSKEERDQTENNKDFAS